MGCIKNVPDSGTYCLSGAIINHEMAKRVMKALEMFHERLYETCGRLAKDLLGLFDHEELNQWAARKAKYAKCQAFGKHRKKRHRRRPYHRKKQCRRGKL